MVRSILLLLLCGCVQRTVALEIDPTSCEAHLTCLAAHDPDEATLREATYGSGGTCWSSEEESASCVRFCEASLARDHYEHPELESCDPTAIGLPAPDPRDLFGQSVTTSLTPVEPGCMTGATWQERIAFGTLDGSSVTVTLVEGGFWQQDVIYTCSVEWFEVMCEPFEVTVPDGRQVTTKIDVTYDASFRGTATFSVLYADENGATTCEAALAGPI